MPDHAHGHGHSHPHSADAARGLRVALALTTAFLGVEVAAGLLTGSLALLADAGHMLTDVGGLALSLFAMAIARRPATPERTYGLYRAEIIAAVLNAAVLLAMAGVILWEAYRRFIDPPAVLGVPMLIVAALGLVVNVIGLLAMRDRRTANLNIRGAYLELLSDAVSSVGVMAAAAIIWLTGWYFADPIVSVAIALYIVPRSWTLLKEAVGILLEGTPSDVNLPQVRMVIEQVDGVRAVHDLHVWSLTSGVNALSAHVVPTRGTDWEDLLRRVHGAIRTQCAIQHLTVQLEPDGWECGEVHL